VANRPPEHNPQAGSLPHNGGGPHPPDCTPAAQRNAQAARPVLRSLSPVERGLHLFVAAAFAAAIALAIFVLAPDPSGRGAHRQLGLPPCMLEYLTGIPCPLCGMTTSFTLMARGRILQALDVQPAGALAFSALIVAIAALLLAAAAGRGLNEWAWRRFLSVSSILALIIIIAAWCRGIYIALT